MTPKDKQLLLIDLAARVPYGVRVLVRSHKGTFNGTLVTVTTKLSSTLGEAWIEETDEALWCDYSLFKPYLRPLSSMTEEEQIEFSIFIGKTETYVQQICLDADSMANPIIGGGKCVYWGLFDKCIDWLNAHHFDYHRLIEMGLALEAPEGMYN